MTYLNFHAHSMFSLLDALPEPAEIAKANVDLGNDAFVITDHGTLGAWIKAYKAAEKYNIQFIPGCEFYITPSEDDIWKVSEDHLDCAVNYHHLLAVAKNQEGVKSLIKLYNSATEYTFRGSRGFKSVITEESLFKYSDGLIVTNACISGPALFYLRNNMDDRAEEWLKRYKEHFGEDFYVELQFHNLTFCDELSCYNRLVQLARKLDIKMIPTTDSHFVNKDDVEYHNIFKDIFFGGYSYDMNKKSFDQAFDGEGYYIMGENEIRRAISHITELTPEDVQECIDNTIELRNRCEPTHFPKANPLVDDSKELRRLVEIGYNKKRLGTEYEEQSKERLEYELSVIEQMKFTEYFINVRNIINRAKNLKILTGPARGCFLPGMIVTTEDGDKAIQDVRIGDKALTNSGEYKNVLGTHEYDVKEQCIELQLSNGKTIRCTKDHKILVDGQWVKAEDIAVGTKLTVPSK